MVKMIIFIAAIVGVSFSVCAQNTENNTHSGYLPDIRRIVTGKDSQGDSYIIEDAPVKAILTVKERPGYRVANVWRTSAAPSFVNAPDTVSQQRGILPPTGGTLLRIIDFPPEPKDPNLLRLKLDATF